MFAAPAAARTQASEQRSDNHASQTHFVRIRRRCGRVRQRLAVPSSASAS
jgi:hypothetical protein